MMPSNEGLLDRIVDWLPTTLGFKRVASWNPGALLGATDTGEASCPVVPTRRSKRGGQCPSA